MYSEKQSDENMCVKNHTQIKQATCIRVPQKNAAINIINLKTRVVISRIHNRIKCTSIDIVDTIEKN